MGGCGDDVGVLARILQKTCCDEPAGCAMSIQRMAPTSSGDSSHALVVPFAGISGGASDDELRLIFEGLLLHVVVINVAFRSQAVRNCVT